MIETQYDKTDGMLSHVGVGTITVSDLLQAIGTCRESPARALWDFSEAEFDVPLEVTASPTFPPIRQIVNERWANTRIAFVVSGHLHRCMVEAFANACDFAFEWEAFFNRASAQEWLNEGTRVH